MRKKLLKHLILALLMTVAVPYAKSQVAHVGDILCEGNAIISPANYPSSGATAIGVVFYVDNTGQHGWAVALEDAGSYKWYTSDVNGGYNTPLPNYSNVRQAIYDLDGYENTRIIRQSDSNHAAFNAVDFANGWYLPAIGQLNYLYSNLIEVNASLQVTGGSLFPATSWRYWSSTERESYYAWSMSSSGELSGYYNSGGSAYLNRKSSSYSVRPVRSF